MNLVVKLEFEVTNEKLAKNVLKSLESDITNTSDFFDRSSLKIETKSNKIELEIQASDIPAAKASINSCLLWLENSINIQEKYALTKLN